MWQQHTEHADFTRTARASWRVRPSNTERGRTLHRNRRSLLSACERAEVVLPFVAVCLIVELKELLLSYLLLEC